jgi:hypothetical protein
VKREDRVKRTKSNEGEAAQIYIMGGRLLSLGVYQSGRANILPYKCQDNFNLTFAASPGVLDAFETRRALRSRVSKP